MSGSPREMLEWPPLPKGHGATPAPLRLQAPGRTSVPEFVRQELGRLPCHTVRVRHTG